MGLRPEDRLAVYEATATGTGRWMISIRDSQADPSSLTTGASSSFLGKVPLTNAALVLSELRTSQSGGMTSRSEPPNMITATSTPVGAGSTRLTSSSTAPAITRMVAPMNGLDRMRMRCRAATAARSISSWSGSERSLRSALAVASALANRPSSRIVVLRKIWQGSAPDDRNALVAVRHQDQQLIIN
jgi:hypothetical protein